MTRLVLCTILVACSRPPCPAPTVEVVAPAPAVEPPPVPAPMPPPRAVATPPTTFELSPGTLLAVVEVVTVAQECSGMGGEHAVLRLLDGSERIAHAGGHGSQLGLESQTMKGRTYLVAEIAMSPTREDHPGGGWCIALLPRKYDGRARRIVRATSAADARESLNRIAKAGLPRYVHDGYVGWTREIDPFRRKAHRHD